MCGCNERSLITYIDFNKGYRVTSIRGLDKRILARRFSLMMMMLMMMMMTMMLLMTTSPTHCEHRNSKLLKN